MKIGYLDCFSGISGDMCLGAIVDAGVPLDAIRRPLEGLPLSGWRMEARRVRRAGLAATLVTVRLDETEHHPHRGLNDVLELISSGALPQQVVERSSAVFRALAEAEARVHGTDTDRVHFHEVGAVDAICDIVGTVIGLRELGIEELRFSTVRLGGGTVKAAHGTLPVPAPATAELLKGMPVAGGPVEMELATPTGAAILKALGRPSPRWPEMTVETVGYGAGGHDPVGHPNVLRLAVGSLPAAGETESDHVWVLETNIDDMTGEHVSYCTELLLAAGALDVFTTPVQMKKNRPGLLLSVLCAPEALGAIEQVLWTHTSTLGVRRSLWQRSKLRREQINVRTRWGEVAVKVAYLGDRAVRCKPEHEDCRRLAQAAGVPLREVAQEAVVAARQALSAGGSD